MTEYSAQQIVSFLENKGELFWKKQGEEKALSLFHQAARRVPAYKDFLKRHKVSPEKIKHFKDFQYIPPVSKKNYLQQYPLQKLCWDGSLNKPFVFTSTSGSTGEPFYFLRSNDLDWESSIFHEFFLKATSERMNKSTLVIVGFGMGVWIAGLITYKAFELASQRGNYPVSIITTGINKAEIIKALRRLSPSFHQTVLVGYPPFIKDVLDEAEASGMNLKKLNLRLLFAAEAFTENFRDYVAKKAHVKDPYFDTLNIYGSADIGTMGYETPTSILIRRLALKERNVFEDIFSKIKKTPTLAQYNPLFIKFEAPNGEILLTGDSAVPLVRYSIGDHGGIYEFSEIMDKFKIHGIDFEKEAKKAKISDHLQKLPFVYIYERMDFSITIYGLQIYPEVVKEALLRKSINQYLTGKLTMFTRFDRSQDQYWELNLELRPGKKLTKQLEKKILTVIIEDMKDKNSEFRELYRHVGERALPHLVFWPAEHSRYFKPGIKQKWVEKA